MKSRNKSTGGSQASLNKSIALRFADIIKIISFLCKLFLNNNQSLIEIEIKNKFLKNKFSLFSINFLFVSKKDTRHTG